MCELDQVSAMTAVNRRQFTRMGVVLGAGATIAACSTTADAEGGLTERMVSFSAAGGTMDGFFVHPAGTKSPGVILWPDIAGLRPAKMAMGRRLAAAGYAVLVANPFYRSVAGVQFEDFAAFRDGGGFDKVRPWMAVNTPEAIMETAKSVVTWLDDRLAWHLPEYAAVQVYDEAEPGKLRPPKRAVTVFASTESSRN